VARRQDIFRAPLTGQTRSKLSPRRGSPARRRRRASGGNAPPRRPSARAQRCHAVEGGQGGEGWPGGRARACASATSRPGKRAAAAAAAPAASAATTQRSMRSLGPPGAAGGSPASVTYQAGMRWPHHSCRLMHQSRMFSSHLRAARGSFYRWARTRPACGGLTMLPTLQQLRTLARYLREARPAARTMTCGRATQHSNSSQGVFTRSAHTKTCGNIATALLDHLHRACHPNSIPSSQHTHQHTRSTTRHEGSILTKSMLLFLTASSLSGVM